MQTDVRIGGGIARSLKRGLAGVALWVLGRGLASANRLDTRVAREVASWPDGTTIEIGVAPRGPRTMVRKRGEHLEALGAGSAKPDLAVTFKNVDVAVPALLGLKGVPQAFAEHRATLAGDVGLGLSFVRCLYIVEGYLFPDLMTSRILPSPAKREVPHLRAYAALLGKNGPRAVKKGA